MSTTTAPTVSDRLAALEADLKLLREGLSARWSTLRIPTASLSRLVEGVSRIRRILQKSLRSLFTSLRGLSAGQWTPSQLYQDLSSAISVTAANALNTLRVKVNLLFLRNWRYEDFQQILDIWSFARPVVGPVFAFVTSGSGLVVVAGVIGVGVTIWAVSIRSRNVSSATPPPEDGYGNSAAATLTEPCYTIESSQEAHHRQERSAQVRFVTSRSDGQPERSRPHHEMLLRYIHPTTSNWPPAYLRAFDRADKSRAQSDVLTHFDTQPSANTRSKGKETAEKWNGKVVLSREAVLKDLQEGKIGLRQGVALESITEEVCSLSSWQSPG